MYPSSTLKFGAGVVTDDDSSLRVRSEGHIFCLNRGEQVLAKQKKSPSYPSKTHKPNLKSFEKFRKICSIEGQAN